jgi:membrane-bound ClpP family serine protease
MAQKSRTEQRRYVWGVILIALGAIFLVQELFNIQVFSAIVKFWPVLLILWGVSVISDKR